jgi:hypothetical protein
MKIEGMLEAVFPVGFAPGSAMKLKYKRLKLGDGQAYDRSSDSATIVA